MRVSSGIWDTGNDTERGVSTGGIELSGMVLRTAAAGEYDRRIVLLTRERGKITAFARGARRSGSALTAATVPFAFGTFRVYEGKSAYTCVAADISHYFEKLKTDYIGACYGAYFMEFADYYAQENLDGTDLLNLLYVSLKMLEKEDVPNRLVRYAFEVRLMVQGGEFPVQPDRHQGGDGPVDFHLDGSEGHSLMEDFGMFLICGRSLGDKQVPDGGIVFRPDEDVDISGLTVPRLWVEPRKALPLDHQGRHAGAVEFAEKGAGKPVDRFVAHLGRQRVGQKRFQDLDTGLQGGRQQVDSIGHDRDDRLLICKSVDVFPADRPRKQSGIRRRTGKAGTEQ